jgi:hypothetical protein
MISYVYFLLFNTIVEFLMKYCHSVLVKSDRLKLLINYYFIVAIDV